VAINSFDIGFPTHSSSFRLNAVASHSLGPIEGLIRRFHYRLWRGVEGILPGCTDTHGYPNLFLSTRGLVLPPGLVGGAILPPDRKL
jgi:hypothetical protein